MKSTQNKSEQPEVKPELKPFFFSKTGETIMAASLEEAQEILAKRQSAEVAE